MTGYESKLIKAEKSLDNDYFIPLFEKKDSNMKRYTSHISISIRGPKYTDTAD